jgi:hypothetical protein
MANFFTSSTDLLRWVKENNTSHKEASAKLMSAIGNTKHEQDIAETTKRIFSNRNVENAADVLFELLSKYDITSNRIKHAEVEYDKQIVAMALAHYDATQNTKIDANAGNTKTVAKNNTVLQKTAQIMRQPVAENSTVLQKTAQIMRQPGQYDMDLRVCPKLPKSVGNRLISTYNCRHYCLDGITFDDDPGRVYCGETMWRKHVLDKFSREWQDPKTGEWVGGYINNRFYVFPDAGTPGNPGVDRCQGNKMSLAPWERSKQPKKHEWSMERRLEEQRSPGSTKSIVLHNVVASAKNTITITGSGNQSSDNELKDDNVSKIFSELIDMNNNGISPSVAIATTSDKYKCPIEKVAILQETAMRKMSSHQADAYRFSQNTLQNTDKNTFFAFPDGIRAKVDRGGSVSDENIAGMPVKPLGNEKLSKIDPQTLKQYDVFEVYNPQDVNSQSTPVANAFVEKGVIGNAESLKTFDELQRGAEDVGLMDDTANVKTTPDATTTNTTAPDVATSGVTTPPTESPAAPIDDAADIDSQLIS